MPQIAQSTTKRWALNLEDGRHNITFKHRHPTNTFSQNRSLIIDNRMIENERIDYIWPLTTKTYPFQIGNHQGVIRIKAGIFRYYYHLLLDGVSVETIGQATSLETIETQTAPSWVWLFYILCGGVAFVLIMLGNGGIIGDTLAGAIGAGGAGICSTIAAEAKQSVLSRVSKCLVATILCWGIFTVLIMLKIYIFRFA
jgi:hypothetical protein